MWIRKEKYKKEKMKANERIEYLENIICPCNNHDYHKMGYKKISKNNNIYYYKCYKCGKTITTNKDLFM